VRGKGTRLGEHCPKVRLSQDWMPIEILNQQQSWVRGKRAFPPAPAKLGHGRKAFLPSPGRVPLLASCPDLT